MKLLYDSHIMILISKVKKMYIVYCVSKKEMLIFIIQKLKLALLLGQTVPM